MRNRLICVTAALLLASASIAMAQTEQKKDTTPAPAAAADATPSLGYIDFGFRGTSTDGDAARYMRYRDLRSGANINIGLGKQTDAFWYELAGTNLGYNDQTLNFVYANHKMKFNAFFDQNPLNYGQDGLTRTPYTESSPGVWTLDSATRQAVEARTAVGILCAPAASSAPAIPAPVWGVCNGNTAANVLTYHSAYLNTTSGFDIKAKRSTFGFGFDYELAKDVAFDVKFQSSAKSGNQPYGMGFAFNNAEEIPISLDNRTNDWDMGLQWGSDKGMIRVGYERSMFNQNIASVTWDNPIRFTDTNDGQPIDMTGNGPWDPSGYSNGYGPAKGRMAMPPSNTLDIYSANALAKLPGHATLSGSIFFGTEKQNDALIPWTTNAVIAQAATYAYFPGLAALPRSTAQAQMDLTNVNLNLTMNPSPWFGFAAKYRYNDRKDRMPDFVSDSTVRFDAVPEQGIVAPGLYKTEPLNASHSVFTADATFTPIPFTAFKVGMGQDVYDHSARAFATLTDTTVRASIDTMGNEYVQIRGMVDRTRRVGTGFNEEAITGGGGQPNARFYDDAERTRDRATVLFTVSPTAMFDVTFSYVMGEDKYDGMEQEFGLMNNKNTSANFGATLTPNAKVQVGFNYGQDKFDSQQQSRNANPSTGAAGYDSWFDANRNWNMANHETVKNFDLFLDLIKAMPNTDIRFGYVLSDSDQAFVLGGPRTTALQNNSILTAGDSKPCASGLTSCFEQMPNVTNKWRRLTADLRYDVSRKVAIGVSYWYEKLDVTDFNTINNADGTPRIDYFSALSTGYGNRPYTGNTFFGRIIYNF